MLMFILECFSSFEMIFFSLFLSIFFFRCFCLCSLIWSVYMPVIVSFQVITYHYLSGSDFKSGFVSHSFDSVCFWYRKIENKSIWCDSSKSYSPHDNWFIVFCVFFGLKRISWEKKQCHCGSVVRPVRQPNYYHHHIWKM